MLKISYGISDYKLLKEEEYYYVDKTNLKKYIVIFVGNDLKLLEEV